MDIEKLKKIAYMAEMGTEEEKNVAIKILRKHGYEDHTVLLDPPSRTPDYEDDDFNFDDIPEITDEMLRDFEQKIVDKATQTIKSFMGIFRNIRF